MTGKLERSGATSQIQRRQNGVQYVATEGGCINGCHGDDYFWKQGCAILSVPKNYCYNMQPGVCQIHCVTLAIIHNAHAIMRLVCMAIFLTQVAT